MGEPQGGVQFELRGGTMEFLNNSMGPFFLPLPIKSSSYSSYQDVFKTET